MTTDLTTLFRRHLCQTSDDPMGIVVDRARGVWVWDDAGTPYLDLLAGMGVANVGHAHPEVLAAAQAQMERHLHVMVYGEMVQDAQVRLAARLAALLPASLDSVYFTSTGAEAIEGAMKTARKHTGRTAFVAFERAFHGDTFGALSLGGNPRYTDPFRPLLQEVRLLPFDREDGLDAIDERVAAVVVEPVQAEGGVRIPGAGFLAAVRRRCDAVGALLVFDEVVTGLGRTGRRFAFQHWDVVPDLLVLAKALGGGFPLGAFIGSSALLRTLSREPALAHVTTFGGHPVSCAAGFAALEILERDALAARADAMGRRLADGLRSLIGRAGLRDVRGVGLLLGIDFDDPAACARFAGRAHAERLILNWTLHDDTVIRLAPPLVLAEGEVDDALARLTRAVG